MTAQLQLVGDPVSADDAARKAYVDALLPAGVILPYGGTAAPSGRWALCNGASLSTTAYATLFAVIGYRFGGGGGSFSLPDCRGKFITGVNTATSVGDTGGTANAVNISHSHTMKNHVHGLNSHAHNVDINHNHASAVTDSDSHTHQTTPGGTAPSMYSIAAAGGLPTSGDAGWVFASEAVDPAFTGVARLPVSATSKWNNGAKVIENDSHQHGYDLPALGSTTKTTTGASGNTEAPNLNTTSTEGSSGTNANLPPYVTVEYIIKVS